MTMGLIRNKARLKVEYVSVSEHKRRNMSLLLQWSQHAGGGILPTLSRGVVRCNKGDGEELVIYCSRPDETRGLWRFIHATPLNVGGVKKRSVAFRVLQLRDGGQAREISGIFLIYTVCQKMRLA